VVLPQALSWKLLGRQLYGTPSEATGHLAACHPWRDRPTFKRLAARLGVSPSRLWLIGAEVAAAPSHDDDVMLLLPNGRTLAMTRTPRRGGSRTHGLPTRTGSGAEVVCYFDDPPTPRFTVRDALTQLAQPPKG
jgi:hypothetical protein